MVMILWKKPKKGAKAAIVSRPMPVDLPQIVVENTIETLGKLATLWRMQFSLPIVGVTGSNGKTTLKNMIASIFQAACQNDASQVLATAGNLNNNIGVPLMLARLNSSHRYAVIEMGMNHLGEIAYLTQMTKPQVAVINNAAESHLEGLKSVAGVAQAKGEIFLGLNNMGVAILNQDDAHFTYWQGLVGGYKQLTFGLQSTADVTAESHKEGAFSLKTPQGTIEVELALLGEHNIKNALAATAATLAVGIELSAIKTGLENVRPVSGRMRQYQLSPNVRIIDDTYNANPFSLQAAIKTLVTLPGKKVVVLGDMKELGPDAKQIHFLAGQKIRSANIDNLYTFGELSAATAEGFGQPAKHFTDRAQLIAVIKEHLTTGTTILIKGSRSMQMEKVVQAILPTEKIEHLH